MTLTLTPDTVRAAIRITATKTGATITALERHDRGGYQLLTTTGTGPLLDYTCALGGPVQYVVTWSDGTTETAETTLIPTDARPQMHTLTGPDAAGVLRAAGVWVPFDTITDLSDKLEDQVVVLERFANGQPYVYRNPQGKLTGTIKVWQGTHGHARGLAAHLSLAPVQWLRLPDHDRADRAIVVTSTDIDPDQGAWSVTLQYTDLQRTPAAAPHTAVKTLDSHGTSSNLAQLARTYLNLAGVTA